MMNAIETNQMCKNYGNVKAVQHLSLRVSEGEIYAFLGLNGAGKTTTIRMLLGMIKPSSGSAVVLGTKVGLGQTEPWSQVGYLVESPRAYPELTVRENLEVSRRLHPGTPQNAVNEMIERLSLTAYADRRAGNLSQGNAQRLGLAKALLHKPRLLILDEPANGLDPAGIVEIRELLLDLTNRQGITVFMSSHILAEVARLAQRIGIIHEGCLVQELDKAELERNRIRQLILSTRNLENARAVLSTHGYTTESNHQDSLLLTSPQAVNQPDRIAELLVHAGEAPTRLVVEEEDLEQYFLRLIGMKGGNNHA